MLIITIEYIHTYIVGYDSLIVNSTSNQADAYVAIILYKVLLILRLLIKHINFMNSY